MKKYFENRDDFEAAKSERDNKVLELQTKMEQKRLDLIKDLSEHNFNYVEGIVWTAHCEFDDLGQELESLKYEKYIYVGDLNLKEE